MRFNRLVVSHPFDRQTQYTELTARLRSVVVLRYATELPGRVRAPLERFLELFVVSNPVGVSATYRYLKADTYRRVTFDPPESPINDGFGWGEMVSSVMIAVGGEDGVPFPPAVASGLQASADRAAMFEPRATQLPDALEAVAAAYATGVAVGWGGLTPAP